VTVTAGPAAARGAVGGTAASQAAPAPASAPPRVSAAGVRVDSTTDLSAAATGELQVGGKLMASQGLSSPGGAFVLKMQTDGNPVLYPAASATALWASGTTVAGAFAQPQTDGRFVVYRPADEALWATNSGPAAGAFLAQQDDGDVVVYSGSHQAPWDRSMFISRLPSGYELHSGQEVVPEDWKSQLIMQADGNFVLYPAGAPAAILRRRTATGRRLRNQDSPPGAGSRLARR
jgi:hypothetical protein